jgi:hypothetical protein
VLDSLDELDDVEFAFADDARGLLLLALRPGANPGKVAAKARGLIQQKTADRVGVWVPTPAAAQIQQTPPVGRNKKVVAVVQASVAPAEGSSWLFWLLALLMVVGLTLLWRWRKVFVAMTRRS